MCFIQSTRSVFWCTWLIESLCIIYTTDTTELSVYQLAISKLLLDDELRFDEPWCNEIPTLGDQNLFSQ